MSEALLQLSDNEKQSLDQLKGRVQQEALGDFTDVLLVQFLMARKFEVERAITLLKNNLAWRKEHQLDEQMKVDDVMKELSTLKMIMMPNAHDVAGAQLIFFRPRMHFPRESLPADVLKMAVFLLQNAIQRVETQRNGFVFIIDGTNAGWHNFDLRLPRFVLDMLQSRFPGRLRKFLILNPPWFFRIVFKLVRPFMSEKFASKLHLLHGKEQLLEHIDKNCLIEEYGGTLPFDKDQYLQMFTGNSSNQNAE